MTRFSIANAAVALLGLLGFGSADALAQDGGLRGYSTDIELVRPTFTHRGIHGVATPGTNVPGTFRYGLVAQYSKNPLTLYNFDIEEGAVVVNRSSFVLGTSVDISENVTAVLTVPTAWNSGNVNIPAYSGDGFGMGDIGANFHFTAFDLRMLTVGARAGMMLPTGRRNMYLGEKYLRGNIGLLAMLSLGPLTAATDLGIMLRGALDTEADFILGPELDWNHGVRMNVPGIPFAFTGTLAMKGGFFNFLKGGAENSMEALGGVQFRPIKIMRIDLAAGRGFTEGYGTSDVRVLGGFVFDQVPWQPPPPPPPPPPVKVETVAIEEIPDPPPIEPVWQEGELARVVGEQIRIREKLQFRVNTAILLEESVPVAKAIAEILNSNALVGHVVIEGHASEEGRHDFNYELSRNRSRTIFEELLKAGVYPDRLSYRGMGEVDPLVAGDDEVALATNRRVEFHIVKQYSYDEELPKYPDVMDLPWNGMTVKIVQPPAPEPPEEESPDGFDDFDEVEEAETNEESTEDSDAGEGSQE
jgi:outer membrane protein OmpA-like peptidoglycan-associated protein